MKNYHEANPGKYRQHARDWGKANPNMDRAKHMLWKAQAVKAVPPWFSELDQLIMLEAVNLCRQREKITGFKWHVDHQVPLRSSRVCGLHIGVNIAVIPAATNCAKGNRYWPDMP